mgnify:FL=1
MLGERLGTFIAEHPRAAIATAIGIPLATVGIVKAVQHFTGKHSGPEAAATGATLLTAYSFTPENTAHLQPAFEVYDTNKNGRIDMRTEGSRWEIYLELWCEDKHGKRKPQTWLHRSCDVPNDRATLQTYSIAPLLMEADRNHNGVVSTTEFDRVLRTFDTHDAYGRPGHDGILQESEYQAFLARWGERIVHANVLPHAPPTPSDGTGA